MLKLHETTDKYVYPIVTQGPPSGFHLSQAAAKNLVAPGGGPSEGSDAEHQRPEATTRRERLGQVTMG